MAGGITYDNVETEDGGNIFQGASFWVSQRVPLRKTLLKAIQDNGGTIVKVEAEADILIADHALKKDAPLASYSWQYISDSVKNGISQIPDKYRIHPDPEDVRPTNGPGPKKGGRTQFTKADDAQLAAWVLSHTSGREGNEIYKELEKKDPRHTWQSWRYRWVKQLRPLPMSELEAFAKLWYSLSISKPEPSGEGGRSMTEVRHAVAGPSRPPPTNFMTMNNPPPDPQARAWLAEQARAGAAAMIEAREQQRQKLAEQASLHQRQQQQRKAEEASLNQMQQQQRADPGDPSSMQQRQKPAAAVKYLGSKNNIEEDEDSEEDDFEQAAVPRHLRSTPPRPSDSQVSKGKLIATQVPLSFEEEDEDSESEQIRQEALLSKVNKTLSKSHADAVVTTPSRNVTATVSQVPVANKIAEDQSSAEGDKEDSKSHDAQYSDASGSADDESEDGDARGGEKAARFYKDLLAFDGVKAEDFREGLLEGPDETLYEISLYDLCEAVILFNDNAAGVDWYKVAERLELEEHEWVPVALEVCYNDRLKDFHDLVINGESQAVDDEGIEAQIRQQLESEAELPAMGKDLVADMNASIVDDEVPEEETGDEIVVDSGIGAKEEESWPTTRESVSLLEKRKIERVESTASARKRRREGEGAEIPSTPDTARKAVERQRQQQLYDLDKLEDSGNPQQRPVKRRLRNQITYDVPEPRRSTRATRSHAHDFVEPEPNAKQNNPPTKGKDKDREQIIEIPDTYEEDNDLGTGPVTQPPTAVMGGPNDSDDVFMDMDEEPVQGTDDEEEEIPTPKPRKAVKRSKLPFGPSSGNLQHGQPTAAQTNIQSSPSIFWSPTPPAPIRDPLKEGSDASFQLLKEHGEQNFRNITELKEFLTKILGYDAMFVEEAIHRVSAFPGAALIECVHSLQKDMKVPNCQGVWTDHDDERLLKIVDYDFRTPVEDPVDRKTREHRRQQRTRLLEKHLKDGMVTRTEYLSSKTFKAYRDRKREREEEQLRREGHKEGSVSTARWVSHQSGI